MRSRLLFFFLIFSPAIFSQEMGRSVLNGAVVSDSLEVESITIENITSKNSAIADSKGQFRIPARERDTLVFSGVAFKSSVLVITKSHFADESVKIRLKVRVNELEELIVRPYTLTGNLDTDSKKLKVQIVDLSSPNRDFTPEPQFNKAENALKNITPGNGNQFNGIDFVKLGKMLFKPKPKEKKVEFITEKNFVDAVKEKYTPQFFKETLKLEEAEVELFLQFCDSNPTETRILLNPKKEFELIDFLIKKSEEYLKKNR